MICRNCQANVDDDLIFCTNCGARLYETDQSAAAETMTQIAQPRPKKSSNLKWIALIVALISVPAALLGGFLLLRKSDAPVVVQNTKPTPTRKANSNVSNNATNAVNNSAVNANQNFASNDNQANGNANVEDEDESNLPRTEVFNQQIEIAPGEHIAHPFKLATDAKLVGDLQTVRGQPVQGYLYFQSAYDEHFPDPTFKVSSFDGENPQFEQVLVAGDYVLVFLNENKTPTTIKGKFSSTPFDKFSK